jgi:hypothetical protein
MRRDLGWSQQQAFEALREGLHLGPKSRASYIAIDMGKRLPTVGEQEFLIRYFGKSPDDFPDDLGDAEPADLLVDALRGQTDAISALVGRLDRLTAEQAAIAVEMMKALGIIGARVLPETPGEDERGARAGTGQ